MYTTTHTPITLPCSLARAGKNYGSLFTWFVSVSSLTITPASPSVAAGNSLSLTCSANTSGRGTPSFMWTGQMSRGPVPGQTMENENMFTDVFDLGRVGKSNAGDYTCQVSLGTSSMSSTVTLIVFGELTSII